MKDQHSRKVGDICSRVREGRDLWGRKLDGRSSERQFSITESALNPIGFREESVPSRAKYVNMSLIKYGHAEMEVRAMRVWQDWCKIFLL